LARRIEWQYHETFGHSRGSPPAIPSPPALNSAESTPPPLPPLSISAYPFVRAPEKQKPPPLRNGRGDGLKEEDGAAAAGSLPPLPPRPWHLRPSSIDSPLQAPETPFPPPDSPMPRPSSESLGRRGQRPSGAAPRHPNAARCRGARAGSSRGPGRGAVARRRGQEAVLRRAGEGTGRGHLPVALSSLLLNCSTQELELSDVCVFF